MRRASIWLFLQAAVCGGADAQVTPTDYQLLGLVREMPTNHSVVADFSDGSSITWHEIVLEITKSDPPLWGGSTLRVRYRGTPAIGAHTISPGDTFSFTLKRGRDPGNIEWQDID